MWPFKKKLLPENKPVNDCLVYLKKNCISPVKDYIMTKTRLNARVKIANRWGCKHPKLILLGFIVTLCSVAAADIIVSSAVKRSMEISFESPIVGVSRFSYLEDLDKKKMLENKLERHYVIFMGLTEKLDSLNKIPRKTHSDSIEIARVSRKILNYDNPS